MSEMCIIDVRYSFLGISRGSSGLGLEPSSTSLITSTIINSTCTHSSLSCICRAPAANGMFAPSPVCTVRPAANVSQQPLIIPMPLPAVHFESNSCSTNCVVVLIVGIIVLALLLPVHRFFASLFLLPTCRTDALPARPRQGTPRHRPLLPRRDNSALSAETRAHPWHATSLPLFPACVLLYHPPVGRPAGLVDVSVGPQRFSSWFETC